MSSLRASALGGTVTTGSQRLVVSKEWHWDLWQEALSRWRHYISFLKRAFSAVLFFSINHISHLLDWSESVTNPFRPHYIRWTVWYPTRSACSSRHQEGLQQITKSTGLRAEPKNMSFSNFMTVFNMGLHVSHPSTLVQISRLVLWNCWSPENAV